MSLSYALLGLLSGDRPMNGYAIKAFFDQAISHVWQAKLSQIYRELDSLESKGLLVSSIEEQRDRPSKRLYRATEEGRRVFLDWLGSVPSSYDAPQRDEFMLRLFFGSLAGKDLVRKEFQDFLENMRRRRASFEDLHSHLAERFPGDPTMARADQICREDRYCEFIRRRAIIFADASIAWAEECLAELEAEGDGRA